MQLPKSEHIEIVTEQQMKALYAARHGEGPKKHGRKARTPKMSTRRGQNR